VYAFATHGVFSGEAGDRIAKSQLEKVIVTDSIMIKQEFKDKVGDKFQQISIDLLMAEAIRRLH
jgi:ribose-phosphate pyrophosphokinase